MSTLTAEQVTALRAGLKRMIFEECNVEGVTADQVADDEPVIGGTNALKLDSLDAVEIVAALEKNFGFRMQDVGAARKIFRSFVVMSDYVASQSTAEKIAAFNEKYRG